MHRDALVDLRVALRRDQQNNTQAECWEKERTHAEGLVEEMINQPVNEKSQSAHE